MNITKKLEAFARITEEEAAQRRKKILVEIDTRVKSEVDKSRKEAMAQNEAKVNLAESRAGQAFKREAAIYDGNIKRDLILKREELKGLVFSEVKEKLLEYVLTEEYINELDRSISESIAGFSEYEITVDKRDLDRLTIKGVSYKDKLKTSNDNIIGGCKILFPSEKRALDNTYKTKLEDAEDDFRGFESVVWEA